MVNHNTLTRILQAASLIAAFFIFHSPASAQTIFELTCPAGTTSIQALQTADNLTGKFRQNYCVDSKGNVFENNSQISLITGPNGVFSSMALCYASIPAGGGTCRIPSNWSETWNSSLTMNKNMAGFLFEGPANINMGTNQIILTAGTFGAFIKGIVPFGGFQGSSGGAIFTYSGSSNQFQIGGSALSSRQFSIENIQLNLTNSGAATGIYLTNVIYFSLINITINTTDSAGTTGIICDGTGNFCGTGTILNPIILAQVGILGTGSSGVNGMNTVSVIGGTIQSNNQVGSIGLNLDQATGDFIYGIDIESEAVGVRLGSGASYEDISFRTEVNTSDVTAVSGSTQNHIQMRQSGPSVFTYNVSDSGVGNIINPSFVNSSFTFVTAANSSNQTQTLATPPPTPRNYTLSATAYQVLPGAGCTGNTTLQLAVSAHFNGIGGAVYPISGWSTQANAMSTTPVLAVNNGSGSATITYTPFMFQTDSSSTAIQALVTYALGAGCTTNPTYIIAITLFPVR